MPLLEVAGLTKHFVRKPGLFGKTSIVKAVEIVRRAYSAMSGSWVTRTMVLPGAVARRGP